MKGRSDDERHVSIWLQHHMKHKPYYDVAMPPDAAETIRACLELSTPGSLVSQIQNQYPAVTANQVHSAWSSMSELLWKRDKDQLPSAKLLLKEFHHDVDIFDIKVPDGVSQLCWGMKKIAGPLESHERPCD
jgi:hypothetical protein